MSEPLMPIFSLDARPEDEGVECRKLTTITVYWLDQPFVVETGEGSLTVSPGTVDDWEDGYFVVYPADGSKPYAMSKRFLKANYEPVLYEPVLPTADDAPDPSVALDAEPPVGTGQRVSPDSLAEVLGSFAPAERARIGRAVQRLPEGPARALLEAALG